jgi:carboxymethylenebutenolidase
MKCPVLFHFGALDTNPSPEDQARYDTEMTRLGILHQFYSYPGADHAFMDYNRDRYQKEASDIAWPRTLEFFAAHLFGVLRCPSIEIAADKPDIPKEQQ